MQSPDRIRRVRWYSAAISLGLFIAGLVILDIRGSRSLLKAEAYCSSGEHLEVVCKRQPGLGEDGSQTWSITVRNSLNRSVTAQASVDRGGGSVMYSNPVYVEIIRPAEDVRVSISAFRCRLIPPAQDAGADVDPHDDSQITMDIGDIAPQDEKTISVRVIPMSRFRW